MIPFTFSFDKLGNGVESPPTNYAEPGGGRVPELGPGYQAGEMGDGPIIAFLLPSTHLLLLEARNPI